MVQALLGMKEPVSSHHAADALAVAICHALAPPLLELAGADIRAERARRVIG
jgi:Holliday junction resolvasome RuvABC endonuclease subunit